MQSFIISSVVQHFQKRLRTAIAESIVRYFDSHSQGTLSRELAWILLDNLWTSLGTVISSSLLLIAFSLWCLSLTWLSFVAHWIGLIVFVALIMGKSQRFSAHNKKILLVSIVMWKRCILVTILSAIMLPRNQKAFQMLNTNFIVICDQFISGIMMPLMILGNFGYVMVVLSWSNMALNGDGRLLPLWYMYGLFLSLVPNYWGLPLFQQASAAMGRVIWVFSRAGNENDEHKSLNSSQL